ncbi:MAG: Polyribonucleotide nucleotidyltransferase, partial [Parcubacteria group bacterium GW2011_GWA2_47_8]
VLATFGKTTVLATATMSNHPRQGATFFPLTVDFDEKFYATGRIKGSRFVKREGRPTTEAILSARLIDRCIRPLFDHRITNEIQVVVTVLSFDRENDPDVVGIVATSLALAVSDIPWSGPIGAVRVNKLMGESDGFKLNPLYADRENALLSIVLAGKRDQVNMIEAEGNEAPEDAIIESIEFAKDPINALIDFQEKIVKELKPKKREVGLLIPDETVVKTVRECLKKDLEVAIFIPDHIESKQLMHVLKEAAEAKVAEVHGDDAVTHVASIIEEAVGELIMEKALEKGKRADNRAFDEVREIEVTVGALPCPHGSGIFRRGLTQVLSVVTLGAPGDEEHLDGMEIQGTRSYMHHYNFPPFAPGETGPMRGPGRRELGHGALAERAIMPVLPTKEQFPYTIRVVSEVLSSNGSTSMASTCGSTLALMDAGVPIRKPVAGIAMGLIYESEKKYRILTDIQGPEDHSGHMDFKVAGTRDGITALQMDVKVEGLPTRILKEALDQAKQARLHILAEMAKVIAEPRPELSPTAPRVIVMMVDPTKIRDIIGSGGETINKIIDQTGATIDIEDDGKVYITSENQKGGADARAIIESIVKEYQVGDIVSGKIASILEFGAFVAFAPKKQGMVHISELKTGFVKRVEDVVKVGDMVTAKVIKIDDLGRYNLSIKALEKDKG